MPMADVGVKTITDVHPEIVQDAARSGFMGMIFVAYAWLIQIIQRSGMREKKRPNLIYHGYFSDGA